MNALNIPLSHSIIFWSVAIGLSIFQGIRGIFIQIHYKKGKWTKAALRIHCIHDFLFNFICSMSGFVCYFIIALVWRGIPDCNNIETGTGIMLSFLALIAIAGIAGILPHMLFYGKLPLKDK